LSNSHTSAVLNVLLALLFAAIGVGAAVEKRLEALPLALLFVTFAVYSVMRAIRVLRGKQS
jgi:hypothetical protein